MRSERTVRRRRIVRAEATWVHKHFDDRMADSAPMTPMQNQKSEPAKIATTRSAESQPPINQSIRARRKEEQSLIKDPTMLASTSGRIMLRTATSLGGKTALRALTARAAGGFVSSTSSNVSIKVGWSWNQSFRESHQFDKIHALYKEENVTAHA